MTCAAAASADVSVRDNESKGGLKMSIRMAPQNIKTTPPNYVDAFLKSPFRLRRLRMVLALVLISSTSMPSSLAISSTISFRVSAVFAFSPLFTTFVSASFSSLLALGAGAAVPQQPGASQQHLGR